MIDLKLSDNGSTENLKHSPSDLQNAATLKQPMPQNKNDEKEDGDPFLQMLDRLLNGQIEGTDDNEDEPLDDWGLNDEMEDTLEDDLEKELEEELERELDEEFEDNEPAFLMPDGTIQQNPNNTIKVEVLPPMKHPREELNRLVGCKGIKERIDELVALSRYNQMMHRMNPNGRQHALSLHSLFLGGPGTGKTTICKIYGSLLKEAGMLSKGHVVVCGRSAFLGSNWGDEERVVQQVVEQAQGGVLMIDEAYQLNGDNKNDPGRLVIPLLMNILADEKQRDIAIVLCGYKKEMKQLLELNPGLNSRFPNKFEFPDFTLNELLEITRRNVHSYNYEFTRAAWAKYKHLLSEAYQRRDPQTWGNARFVSNQLERIYLCHARRCVRSNTANKHQLLTITPADIQPIEVPKPKPRMGF